MCRYDNVTIYIMRIIQVHDHISSIGEKTKDIDIVNGELNGIPKSWEPFVNGFISQENLLDWQRLLDDFIQEDTW